MGTFRSALRALRRNAGFSLGAIAVLALGIAASASIFSVVDAILLRPLRFPHPERLVRIASLPAGERDKLALSNYLDLARGTADDFDQTAAYYPRVAALRTADGAVQVALGAVTHGFFATLGIAPAAGRDFLPEEDVAGRDREAIVSEPFSRTHPLGSEISLNDRIYTIIGVLPAGFRFPEYEETEIWVPLGYSAFDLQHRTASYLDAIGRLKPSVDLARARRDLDVVGRRLAAEDPESLFGRSATAYGLQSRLVTRVRPVLSLLFAAVLLVLLIACANVAGLQIARGTSRRHELAVRAALGASRSRIIGELLCESLLLAVAGGALGLLLTRWIVDAIVAIAPATTPRLAEITVDFRVLAFAVAISVASAVASGLWPALQASRFNVSLALKESAPHATGAAGQMRARRLLAVAEISLALMLVSGAGLLIRSFQRLLSAPLGFDPHGVLTAQVRVPYGRFHTTREYAAFYAELNRRVAALPGVKSSSFGTLMPFEEFGTGWHNSFTIDGRPPPPPGREYPVTLTWASPDFFRILGLHLISGRLFDTGDRSGAQRVIVVNETFARRYFPGEEAVGQRLHMLHEGGYFSQLGETTSDWHYLIVGVIADSQLFGLGQPPEPIVFVPALQQCFPWMNLIVRTEAADPRAIVLDLRRTVRDVDPTIPLAHVRTYDELIAASAGPRKFPLQLLSAFGAIALVLAAFGVYGVIATMVAQRTREFGVRMALGADRGRILEMVLRSGVSLGAAGVLLGLAGSLAVNRIMRSVLFGVSPVDPLTLTVATLLLLAVAAGASLLPARRATRVDPAVAMHAE